MESNKKEEKGTKTWDRVKNSSSLLKYKKMKKQEKKTSFLNKWTLREQFYNFKRELRAEIKLIHRLDMIIQVRKMKRER